MLYSLWSILGARNSEQFWYFCTRNLQLLMSQLNVLWLWPTLFVKREDKILFCLFFSYHFCSSTRIHSWVERWSFNPLLLLFKCTKVHEFVHILPTSYHELFWLYFFHSFSKSLSIECLRFLLFIVVTLALAYTFIINFWFLIPQIILAENIVAAFQGSQKIVIAIS